MRVAIDGLVLGGAGSGVERAVEQMAGAMACIDGLEVGLVCTPAYADRARAAGLQTLVAPACTQSRAGRILFEQLLMSGRLRKQAWPILHGPAYIVPPMFRGVSVVTVYDLIALQYPQWCKVSNVAHFRFMLPASMAAADIIIAPSQTVADSICTAFPRLAPKVRLVHLGIGAQFRPADDVGQIEQVRHRYCLPERFVLCLGNIEPRKNLPAVVAAFERVVEREDVHLVIAGPKSWKCGSILRRIARSPRTDRIHMPGNIAEVDLPTLYSMSALLVQWSLYEGVGLPPLEAMACGTPSIVSDGGALAELAGQAAEIVPLPDPEALADGIVRLLRDESRRKQIATDGAHLAERWTWARHAERVAALYKEASGG